MLSRAAWGCAKTGGAATAAGKCACEAGYFGGITSHADTACAEAGAWILGGDDQSCTDACGADAADAELHQEGHVSAEVPKTPGVQQVLRMAPP